jgi:hypothetical protein
MEPPKRLIPTENLWKEINALDDYLKTRGLNTIETVALFNIIIQLYGTEISMRNYKENFVDSIKKAEE